MPAMAIEGTTIMQNRKMNVVRHPTIGTKLYRIRSYWRGYRFRTNGRRSEEAHSPNEAVELSSINVRHFKAFPIWGRRFLVQLSLP